jgi:hypothetical protein
MREVWIVDDDEEMNRAVGLMLKILDQVSIKFSKIWQTKSRKTINRLERQKIRLKEG